MRRKQEEYAVFPDGDETDCSSRTTFYDICRHSSRSTSISEQSSVDESLTRHVEPKTMFDDKQDEIIRKLTDLPMATVDERNSRCSVTKMTKISAIDIQITSPESRMKTSLVRPSCTTRIRDDYTEPDSSDNEEMTNLRRPCHRGRLNSDPLDALNIRLSSPNKIKLPSIDVIAPSPTLSILSERLIIKEERSGSTLRPGITLSPISVRTLTPLSSLSSSSTMSDTFSFTSGSEDGLLGMRSRLLNRRSVLPPISRNSSEDIKDDVFHSPSHPGRKNKVIIKSKKTKTRSTEDYTCNSRLTDDAIFDRKTDFQRHCEAMNRKAETANSRSRDTVQKQKHSTKHQNPTSKDFSKKERNHHGSKTTSKQARHPNIQSMHGGEFDTDRKPPTRKTTSSSRNSLGTKHLNSTKKTKSSKQDKVRGKSLTNKQRDEYLMNFHRIHSADYYGDSVFSKNMKQGRDSVASSEKGEKSISGSSDGQSQCSKQTESSYL